MQLLRLYQRTLSPDHSWVRARFPYGYCRFSPSCSEYAVQAISRHGIVKGLIYSMIRLVKCHPWHTGGIDPVPS